MINNSSARAFELQRVTALIGPFGSGKTELSIGLALYARSRLDEAAPKISRVVLADVDVLKPYFRSREVRDQISRAGIELMAPPGALAMSDLPIITAELRGSFLHPDWQIILDVGGDPVGARALGSLSDVISPAPHDLLLVLNRNRPFMDSLEQVIEHARQIVAATHLRLTGVISNTHMLEDTTEHDVLWGLELAQSVAGKLSVPVRLAGIPEHLISVFSHRDDLPPMVGIRRRMMPVFLGGVVLAQHGPTSSTPVE